MSAAELLRNARRAGLSVWVEAGKLRVRGPAEAARLVEELRASRDEILRHLEREQDGPWPVASWPITPEMFRVRTLDDLLALKPPCKCRLCGEPCWGVCIRCDPPRPRRADIESWREEEGWL